MDGCVGQRRSETISNVDQRSSTLLPIVCPLWLSSQQILGVREELLSLSSHCFFLNWKLDQRLGHVARARPHTLQPDLSSEFGVCLGAFFLVVFPGTKKRQSPPPPPPPQHRPIERLDVLCGACQIGSPSAPQLMAITLCLRQTALFSSLSSSERQPGFSRGLAVYYDWVFFFHFLNVNTRQWGLSRRTERRKMNELIIIINAALKINNYEIIISNFTAFFFSKNSTCVFKTVAVCPLIGGIQWQNTHSWHPLCLFLPCTCRNRLRK